VVLVEVGRKAYLASIVPVIVNAILNEHQIVVDIVAFVNKGDFPRSRLGEKQRGKILASWVTRKMRTMAQFGIRDPESGLSDVTETMEPRSGIASLRNGSVMASSLRNVESAPQIIEEQRELERLQAGAQNSFVPLPTGLSEMPAQNYDDSVLGSPRGENGTSTKSDDTPTDTRHHHFELPVDDYDPEKHDFNFVDKPEFEVPGFEINEPPQVPPPRIGPKPGTTPQINLPAVEGREGDLWTLPSQQARGGLRVQNASSDDDEDEWKSNAIMHMNLAGR
jgi:hypothetical protein